jgi:alanine adding enzyme
MQQFMELTRQEFESFSMKHEQGNYLQSSAMAELLEQLGWQTNFIGIKKQENVLGGALIASKSIKFGRYFTIMGGPLLAYEDQEIVADFMKGIRQFVKKHQGIFLNFSPNLVHHYCDQNGTWCGKPQKTIHHRLISLGLLHNGFKPTLTEGNPRVIYTKDLTGMNEQRLLKTYHGSVRRKIRKTSKYGMRLRELLKEELPLFTAVMEHTAQRQGFQNKDLAYYEALYDSFGEQAHFMATEINFKDYAEDISLEQKRLTETIERLQNDQNKVKQKLKAEAEQAALTKRFREAQKFITSDAKKQILAVGLFIEMPQEMLFLFGGMYDQYKNFLSPAYFLQHQMLKAALNKGITRYNFYGIAGIYDGSDSILNFKKGFKGIVEEQVGTYTLIVRPFKYHLYILAKKCRSWLKNFLTR